MSKDKDPPPGVGTNDNPFAHLMLRPGMQSEEWKKREADRRAGRGRKDWWKQLAPPPLSQDKPERDNGE
jgi:hypothetical protein